mgnify:CR=1 FL=1
METLKKLYDTIIERKESGDESSYTRYLFGKGLDKILKKCGEECAEMIIAAKNGDESELVYESCDLIYHMLVLLCHQGIDIGRIEEELERRSLKQGNLKPSKSVDKDS